MQTLPSNIIDLLEAGRLSVRYMLRFELDDGAQGLWNDVYPVVHEGVTFHPMGGNLQLDALPGSSDLSSDAVSVTISGLDPNVAGLIETKNWHQRAVIIYRALMSDAGTVLDARAAFAGFLDEVRVTDAAEAMAAVILSIESNNRELNRSSGRMRSDPDQRAHGNASDGFFKYATAAATDTDIYWGRKGPTSPVR